MNVLKGLNMAGFRFILVATLRGEKDKIVGYNVLQYYPNKGAKLMQIPAGDKGLAGIKFENAVIEADGTLKGTNGSLDRYAKIVSKNGAAVMLSRPLVVISKLRNGFILSDGMGNLARMTYKEALAYFKLQGIANGKIVKDNSGKEFISAIRGNFVEEDIEIPVAKPAAPVAGKEAPKEKREYSNDFYSLLEKAYGKKRAALIKYMIEYKGVGNMDAFAQMLKECVYGAEVIALIMFTTNSKDDKKLEALIGGLVEDEVINTVKIMSDNGVAFDTLWDVNKTLGYNETGSKKIITNMKVYNIVVNYLVDSKKAINGIEMKEDEVYVDGKKLTGFENFAIVGIKPTRPGDVVLQLDSKSGITKVASFD